MDFMTAFDIGASALSAERTQINITSMNLANVKTTRTPGGGPYQRKAVTLAAENVDSPFSVHMKSALDRELRGVRVMDIARDQRPFKQVYEPGHPDANQEGYVLYPDINVVEEMTNMMTASRGYEANVTSIETIKNMFNKALMLGT
ncbi:flagellar basal body rod protein FlgC [Oceanidesulfovibrio indonesiensis]|uniref:Flagellar basal-body rod protein FlgC n=1 Tax=Oceanidesulfovibrio indonesiensis TaxID=54767 RepID=A0A7M3MAD0_9BACT|nr:flagellar basal body rod protein FlgC [Oceanidesulfovibrio indonesiensis]TVM14594.1 flagellar basal body rod protein FlgC [Oceanidesulfovibrio indonesiensis]